MRTKTHYFSSPLLFIFFFIFFVFHSKAQPLPTTDGYTCSANQTTNPYPCQTYVNDDRDGVVTGLAIGLGITGFLLFLVSGFSVYRDNSLNKKGMVIGEGDVEKHRFQMNNKGGKMGKDSMGEEVSLIANVSDCLDKYRVFGIDELQEATNGFSDGCLIQGSVYKGSIDGEVFATKKMNWNAYEQLKILQKMKPGTVLWFLVLVSLCFTVKSKCSKGCDLALASYYVWQGSNLSFISQVLGTDPDIIVSFNKDKVPDKDRVPSFIRVNVPFTCDCIRGEFLGHEFLYNISEGNTYTLIAQTYYANLTTIDALTQFNSYDPNVIPVNGQIKVTVNCSCGDSAISKDYGLFITYPIREEDSLESIAANESIDSQLLQKYNKGVDFGKGSGIAYVPGKDANGSYRPLNASSALAGGVIAGITMAAIAAVLILVGSIYVYFYLKKKADIKLLPAHEDQSSNDAWDIGSTAHKAVESSGLGGAAAGITGITIDKSVEFSYEELAQSTNNFSLASKIGEGGFGAVYYAELRGEKAAIKKMDMQASKEFLAELRVLTRVHHLNLVRLIGYCVEGSLFLVYEYIENGNLSEHLRGSGKEPLSWSTRVQIALDSARGLEYIHEHTVPVYIHRDIKSANILIDKNFHGKVADFGLAKLTEVGSTSLQTRLVGTFGYMPPEYAQYGDVSSKVDVYAFGVVLYELISSKEAVVKGGSLAESKGLVGLFEDVLNQPDPREDLCKLVDPRLEDNYPIDAVRKMAQLAKACTHENPQLRPSMRSIVVALMTLSSSTEDWDVGSFYENQALVNLMSGR